MHNYFCVGSPRTDALIVPIMKALSLTFLGGEVNDILKIPVTLTKNLMCLY